jgi:ubiquinone/menaquinone biosynthesis C-methylase UbiE
MVKDVKDLYSSYWRYELTRLNRDAYHSLELSTTLRFLGKYLPEKGLILDAGGGTGIYSIELAKCGYDVVLLDYSGENLNAARREIEKNEVGGKIKGVVEGTITDLSEFDDGTFDAVLCLGGPLSLVYGKRNRRNAMSELTRVAKSGATIFISVMNRYGGIALLPNKSQYDIGTVNFINLATKGEDRTWVAGYYCHYFTPAELKEEFVSSTGSRILEMVGLEGLGAPSERAINKLSRNRKAWKNWMRIHYALCTEPEVVGASVHILMIGKKR